MKKLKAIIVVLLILLIGTLMTATVLEKIHGSGFTAEHIYGSPAFVVLWAVIAVLAIVYMSRRKLRGATLLLHLSFALILTGALVTWLFGVQGTLKVRTGETVNSFTEENGQTMALPFSVTLTDFETVYYEGTRSPMDFVSHVTINLPGKETAMDEKISMNNILSCKSYRLTQSGYDSDGQGAIFGVSYDPWGIGLTYSGYGLLLLSMILFFFSRGSAFRSLLKSPLLKGAACLLICLSIGFTAEAKGIAGAEGSTVASAETRTKAEDKTKKEAKSKAKANAKGNDAPKTVPAEVAEAFCDLYVLHGGRTAPLETYAKELTVKLYGKKSYKGLSPEQVLCGWMFYPSTWREEPLLKIKSAAAREAIGTGEKYVSVRDLFTSTYEYKLDSLLSLVRSGEITGNSARGIREADEKYNLLAQLMSGATLKIFPLRDENGALEWYSQSSNLPYDLNEDEWIFIKKSISYIGESIVMKDYEGCVEILAKIREYQVKKGDGQLPSDFRFNAEKLYNRTDFTRPAAMSAAFTGIVWFVISVLAMSGGKRRNKALAWTLRVYCIALFCWLTLTIVLRWIVGGHVPLSNGFETMQFMAWVSLLVTIPVDFRVKEDGAGILTLPAGTLICGMTLMVSMMGASNPRISNLMPVLQSPLLSIHVAVIMISYALFAFMALNGAAALILRKNETQMLKLQVISRILLYPAVFLLTAGIFIGAIWANISWGRYWGWDPKEVWALITMLIYSMPIHAGSLPAFRKPVFFHVFCILAFLSVLITYFGVNFILGGLHSYAG